MDLKILSELPSWEWPKGLKERLLELLSDERADADERLLAAQMAGDATVIDEQLVEVLLAIVRQADAPEALRGQAAISLGPVLELADIDGFDEGSTDYVPISERTFHRIQDALRALYAETDLPKAVRRRILEAAVRAPQDWHREAIEAAYASDDADWKLTAVFAMRWTMGFEAQILESLQSDDEEVHYEAICAAGNWGVEGAWSHVAKLIAAGDKTEKALLLAAIEAVAGIRPQLAEQVLADLTESDDEDVVEAAYEAMALAGGFDDDDFDDDDFDDDDDDDNDK